MAPRQHTFTLVPNPLGMQGLMSRPASGPQSKPPMTSKQAQKLYRQASRGPRLSKAEQRRLEREEQERIRRELDKEKQAAKARTLREKKKAKEEQALAEKKRKGLPLVDVRPSQDTISRFVRGNGAGKKRDLDGAKVDLPVVHEEAEEDDRSDTEDGLDENVPSKQAAGTDPGKRRRSSQSAAADNRHDSGVEAGGEGVDTPAKAVVLPPEGARPAGGGQSEEERKPELLATKVERINCLGAPRTREVQHKPAPGISGRHSPGPPEAVAYAGPLNVDGAGAGPTWLKVPPVQQRRQGTPIPGEPVPRRISSESGNFKQPESVPPVPTAAPLNKQVRTPRPQPCKPYPVPLPQRHQSPSVLPPRHPTTRNALQEITNSPIVGKRAPAIEGAGKFASPYKAALAASRPARPSPAIPMFNQPRAATLAPGVRKPKFLPPHVRHTAARQRSPSPPAGVAQPTTRSPRGDPMSAPPTSTQLFIMSNIDDIFLSPSQEAREVLGDLPSDAVDLPIAAPVQASAAVSAHPRQFTRQLVRVDASVAPAPHPAAAKPAEMSTLPFVCTQDLLLSSQDFRDLDELSPGKTRGRSKPPPFKKHQPQPPPLSRAKSGPRVQAAAPESRAKQLLLAAKHQPTLARVTGPATPSCGNGGPDHSISAAKNQQTLEADKPAPPCLRDLPGKGGPSSRVPPQPVSPEKPRFFGSSGEGVDLLLALDRSRKTHEEEERRRGGQRQARQSVDGNKDEDGERKRSKPGSCLMGGQHSPWRPPEQPSQRGNSRTVATSRNEMVTGGHQRSSAHPAPQETGYSDLELDLMDFDDLDFLEAELDFL